MLVLFRFPIISQLFPARTLEQKPQFHTHNLFSLGGPCSSIEIEFFLYWKGNTCSTGQLTFEIVSIATKTNLQRRHHSSDNSSSTKRSKEFFLLRLYAPYYICGLLILCIKDKCGYLTLSARGHAA